MARSPAARALLTAGLIRCARRHAIPGLGLALERLPPGLLARVEGALAIDWVPLEEHMTVMQCLRNVAGERLFRDINREMAFETSDGAVVKSFRDTAFRLFGVKPEALIRWIPRGFSLILRDVGTIQQDLTEVPGVGRASITGFPRGPWNFETFVEGFGGSMEAQFLVAGAQGTAEVVSLDAASGTAHWTLRWTPSSRT